VLLHLRKVRLRRQPVSTLLFWDQVLAEHHVRAFGWRFRRTLSLVLSLLFLFLLTGAVLNPVLPQNQAGRTVIVFDNSSSMNAIDNGSSRFEAAKIILAKLLASENEQSQIALVTTAGKPQVVFGFTAQSQWRRKAAEAIQPTHQPKKLGQAIELARTIGGDARIFVITDGCCESVKPLLAASDLTFFPIGTPLENVAITRLQARRLPADPLGFEVLIELANHSDTPKECRLELTLEERFVDLRPLTLAANSVETQIFYAQTDQGGILRASVDLTDALAADNTAWAALPARDRQTLLLQGESDFFLRRALQSQQNVELLTGEPPPQTDETVLICHQTVPERIPEGNVLLIDPRGDCDLFTVGGPLASSLIGQTSDDSPLMRFVQLENVLIAGAREIRFPESAPKPQILAAATEGNPIFFQWDRGNQGKVTVLSADLQQGNLVFRTAFPIMVSNILNSFRADGGELGQTFPAAAPSESDLRIAPKEFYDLREGSFPQNASFPPIWFLLTGFALVLIVLEWFLYHRRWID